MSDAGGLCFLGEQAAQKGRGGGEGRSMGGKGRGPWSSAHEAAHLGTCLARPAHMCSLTSSCPYVCTRGSKEACAKKAEPSTLFKHLAPLKVRTWRQHSGCLTLVSKPEPQTRSQKSRVTGLLLPDRPWAAPPSPDLHSPARWYSGGTPGTPATHASGRSTHSPSHPPVRPSTRLSSVHAGL